jgi:hypothetical protein
MTSVNQLDLLLKEIEDEYVQENFYRLKLFIDQLIVDGSLGGSGAGPQGPPGAAGPPGDSFFEKTEDIINSGNTNTIDTDLKTSFTRIKYFITAKGLTSGESKGLDLTVQNDAGTITETVTHRLGGLSGVFFNIVDNATDIDLDVQNTTLEDIQVTVLKTTL